MLEKILKNNIHTILIAMAFITITLQIFILIGNEKPDGVNGLKVNTIHSDKQIECDTISSGEEDYSSNETSLSLNNKQYEQLANLIEQTIITELENKIDFHEPVTIKKREPDEIQKQNSSDNYQIINSQIQSISENTSPEEILDIQRRIGSLTNSDRDSYVESIGSMYANGLITYDTMIKIVP